MKIRIWFRPLVWFLKKDWYAKRKLAYNDGEHGQAFDFGAITIVFIKKTT